MADAGARRRRTARVVALGILLVVAAIAVYHFRNVGCFPGSEELEAARYAECLGDGRRVGLAALAALAVGAVVVVVGAIHLTRERR